MRAGVDLAANLIGATLGPGGRNVAYARSMSVPRLTNDGATIANELEEVRDPVLDLGLQLMRRAAQTADDAGGDGTTTAVVLAQAIVHRGLYNIAAGANGMRLREGLARGFEAAAEALRDLARPVESTEHLRHVATVSSEDPPMGRLLADMAAAVGPDGLILADYHRGTKRLEARYIDGMPIDLLKPILEDMKLYGRPNRPARPWLGFLVQDIGDHLVVASVYDGCPADRAGIEVGDLVVEVAGEPIDGLAELFRKVWDIGPAGSEIPLTIIRDGEPHPVRLESVDRDARLKHGAVH